MIILLKTFYYIIMQVSLVVTYNFIDQVIKPHNAHLIKKAIK